MTALILNTVTVAAAHPFELAGLGKAPFKVLRAFTMPKTLRGETRDGITVEVMTNGVGGCRYCGQAICDIYTVRSSDGLEFPVGSSCVEKAEKNMLGMATAKTRLTRAKAVSRKVAMIATAQDRNAEVLAQLEPMTLESGFAGRFSASVKEQILVRGKSPSAKQMAIIASLLDHKA